MGREKPWLFTWIMWQQKQQNLWPQMREERRLTTEALKKVIMYTDGACSGNPGPGGYGVVLLYKGHRKELSRGYKNTTNNRMEMMAVIKGLEALKEPCIVDIYSDSKYLVDSINKGWAARWRANGWMRNKKERALNVDLWERLMQLLDKHQATFYWIKGHADVKENECCDFLATEALKGPNLLEDPSYR